MPYRDLEVGMNPSFTPTFATKIVGGLGSILTTLTATLKEGTDYTHTQMGAMAALIEPIAYELESLGKATTALGATGLMLDPASDGAYRLYREGLRSSEQAALMAEALRAAQSKQPAPTLMVDPNVLNKIDEAQRRNKANNKNKPTPVRGKSRGSRRYKKKSKYQRK